MLVIVHVETSESHHSQFSLLSRIQTCYTVFKDPLEAKKMEQNIPYGAVVGYPIRLNPGEDLVPAIEKAASQAMSLSDSSSAFVMTAGT